MTNDRPSLRAGLQAVPIEHEGQPMIVLLDPSGQAEQQVGLPPAAMPVLQRLDGRHTLPEIQEAMREELNGEQIPLADLERLVSDLDQCYFLESPRFALRLREQRESYLHRATRPAVHAGAAYPADPAELTQMLDAMLEQGRPYDPPFDGKPLRALIAPHIDYGRGGECYGHAYNTLRQHMGPARRFVIFGTNHHGRTMAYAATRKSFETPLGTVETDAAFLDAVDARYQGDLFADEYDHLQEHSIELQVVMLKHLLGDEPFTIVPVLCSAVDAAHALGRDPAEDELIESFVRALSETAQADPSPTCFIAGVDMAHVGRHFGDHDELTGPWLLRVQDQDRRSLTCVEQGDVDGFVESIVGDDNQRRVCGMSPIHAIMRIAGAQRYHLLHYKQCVDHESQCAVTCAALAGV